MVVASTLHAERLEGVIALLGCASQHLGQRVFAAVGKLTVSLVLVNALANTLNVVFSFGKVLTGHSDNR